MAPLAWSLLVPLWIACLQHALKGSFLFTASQLPYTAVVFSAAQALDHTQKTWAHNRPVHLATSILCTIWYSVLPMQVHQCPGRATAQHQCGGAPCKRAGTLRCMVLVGCSNMPAFHNTQTVDKHAMQLVGGAWPAAQRATSPARSCWRRHPLMPQQHLGPGCWTAFTGTNTAG